MATLGNYLIECLCFVNESTGRFGEMHLVCVRGASGTPHSYEWKAVRASWGGSWLGCTHHMDVLAHGHGVAAPSLCQLAAGPWPAFSLALLSRRLGLPCCLSRAAPWDLFYPPPYGISPSLRQHSLLAFAPKISKGLYTLILRDV